MRNAYYEADIKDFLATNEDVVFGMLAIQHGFVLEHPQKYAWQEQIKVLQQHLPQGLIGRIYFEFSIPRMGKRADVVIVSGGIVFVIEFKVGSHNFERHAIEQEHDYALDLKNFHRGSHYLSIVPILIATKAANQAVVDLKWADDQVAQPIFACPVSFPQIIQNVVRQSNNDSVDAIAWANSGYQPTPTIVEAALALYRRHDVKEITRSEAGADNLEQTASCVNKVIETAKANHRKAICFITGVPGAGKTLAGLNIATSHTEQNSDEHTVFLSGNGPLVTVLGEALARDKSEREGISKSSAKREVSKFIQNIHHFRDYYLRDEGPPVEKVVIFDEAQRAWSREMASKFMQQKRGHANFDLSEPAFLLSVMNRHVDWCVVICLIGGGQEINTGEAGLAEWIKAIRDHHPDWEVFISNRLEDRDYIWDEKLAKELLSIQASREESLHLSVSIRSFRAESLSEFVGHVINNRPELAKVTFQAFADRYPVVLTRNLVDARTWLRAKARGSERFGLAASSGANRLRPEGVWIKSKIDAPVWFLNDKTDVRSSYYLEEAASEFDIQGLELDWACICWDADFRYANNKWQYFNFRGAKWQKINTVERQLYLKNAYRVLLTRARQGMVIFVPPGDAIDPTRRPQDYDQIFNYLISCGIPSL